ncbi:phosphatase PAP2 family protein [Thermodesulfatator atlanticus]|uniref:phosphatase PAP2 family protein n=1 Tax=Thermodesulfatator atlanticus TaxID=501497 RepID=UPI0003B58B71|nr:phosphatase PAP2 family protein [Thermodesulfatator atlanticus]
MATPQVDFLKLFAELDKDVFFYLNHHRHKILDLALPYFSDEKIIYAFFLFFGAILVSLYKWRGLIVALLTWLCVLGTDFTCGQILKPYFARQRPLAVYEGVYCYNYQKKEWYQTTNPTKSKSYSLPSCHAANVACAATILAALLPRFSLLFWAFALTVAYSRIYLGVHYPFDVCFGFVLGYLIGLLGRMITLRVLEE